MKISEILKDKYKLRIPPTVYYELLADVQEAEEAQDPRKGHWIKGHDNVGWWYVCDKCGSTPLWDENTRKVVLSPYCPNCGAKMAETEAE